MKNMISSERMKMGLERIEFTLRFAGREASVCFSTGPLDLPTEYAEPPCT
jgi:hypothetical protein